MASPQEHKEPRQDDDCDNGSESSSSSEDEFLASVDFAGVDFENPQHDDKGGDQDERDAILHYFDEDPLIASLLRLERALAFPDNDATAAFADGDVDGDALCPGFPDLIDMARMLSRGQYAQILGDKVAQHVLAMAVEQPPTTLPSSSSGVSPLIRCAVANYICDGVEGTMHRDSAATADAAIALTRTVEVEILGIASLCLFLQANYTGPALDKDDGVDSLSSINPHDFFLHALRVPTSGDGDENVSKGERKDSDSSKKLTSTKRNASYQNAVLSELAVEGVWPCQVCDVPYSLLLARSLLSGLASLSDRADRDDEITGGSADGATRLPAVVQRFSARLASAPVWCARSAVAHERLLQGREPTETLWQEVQTMYKRAMMSFGIPDAPVVSSENKRVAATEEEPRAPDPIGARIMLEYGLAHHHFNQPGMGRAFFGEARRRSGLRVQVTGVPGRRTKYQKFATAQLLVKASSASSQVDHAANAAVPFDLTSGGDFDEHPKKLGAPDDSTGPSQGDKSGRVRSQAIKHSDDGILLERIKFEDDKENEISSLSVLDQAILLALCLDVKNSNPSDGLTAEEMGGYLAAVLDHHDDWMVYSTALLERAWLEFERSHARERSILQMQALADQHTERLTLTQSTRKSIDELAPAQDRLKMLHCIVYPPRWTMISDLADRYAALGIVSTAAELFAEVEMWDEVVSCYRRAGKLSTAEKIVRERLEVAETPRMLSALGDLTGEPEHYLRAIELSRGRFADAHAALAAHCFDKGDLENALVHYGNAVKVRPRLTHIWFRLGTVAMQLDRWDTALRAFSEVVQQEPDESEAWANVGAIHMHNKQPNQAYPALVESLKQNRSNWRVWVSKLYTCLDLEKFDEAIQACNMILDLKSSSDQIPPLEARCVRAIVGGVLRKVGDDQGDDLALESSRRTLSRVHQLLMRMSSSSDAGAWVFETMAYFHEQVGQDDRVLEDLMKEYRALQAVPSWEKEDFLVRKMCSVVSHAVEIHMREERRECLTKAKWLARGVVTKVRASRLDDSSRLPVEFQNLEKLQRAVEDKLQKIGP
jgi:tetratricopeptide (TPR) repeat protein